MLPFSIVRNILCIDLRLELAKKEKMWASRDQNFVAKMVDVFGEVVKKKFKFIQFVVIFQLLKLGQLLTNFIIF